MLGSKANHLMNAHFNISGLFVEFVRDHSFKIPSNSIQFEHINGLVKKVSDN